MPHKRKAVEKCVEILSHKLAEYISTYDEWHALGYLCPHKGHAEAHEKMDEIIEDVQQAHDMLEIALHLAGVDSKTMHAGVHKLEDPAHASSVRRLSTD